MIWLSWPPCRPASASAGFWRPTLALSLIFNDTNTARERSLHEPHRPEIAAEIGLGQVGVGHREVAFHAPGVAPGIADDEDALPFVVADGHHGVAAFDRLTRAGHGDDAGLGYLGALEAGVDRKSEHEREARGQTALHLGQVLHEALVLGGAVVGRLDEAV